MANSVTEVEKRAKILERLKSEQRRSDIDICFDTVTVPVRGRLARSFMADADRPVHVPTYNALEGVKSERLLVDMFESEIIDSDQARAYVEGRHKYDVLNRLAISYAPGLQICRLAQAGYGIWPVQEGVDLGAIDLRRDGITIGRGMDFIKAQGRDITSRAIDGVWINSRQLSNSSAPVSSNEMPAVSDYLPRVSEALIGLSEYYAQEDKFPNSGGYWLKTSSSVVLPNTDFFQPKYTTETPWDILIDSCIDFSPYAKQIRQLHKTAQDMYNKLYPNNLNVTKRGRSITISKGNEVVYNKAPNELYYLNNDGASVRVGNGFFEIERKSQGRIATTIPLDSLLNEISINKQLVERALKESAFAPIVLKVMPERGLQLGIDFNPRNVQVSVEAKREFLPQVGINIKWFERKGDGTPTASLGLPVVDGSLWPNLIPDPYAPRFSPQIL